MAVNTSTSLLQQGPFHVILHKVTVSYATCQAASFHLICACALLAACTVLLSKSALLAPYSSCCRVLTFLHFLLQISGPEWAQQLVVRHLRSERCSGMTFLATSSCRLWHAVCIHLLPGLDRGSKITLESYIQPIYAHEQGWPPKLPLVDDQCVSFLLRPISRPTQTS